MGQEVERVSGRASLNVPGAVVAVPDEEFGPWFARQRVVRGISVYFVAARTRLTPGRVEAIESGQEPLSFDGQGRALARHLADAIGADPQEAAAHLIGPRRRSRRLPGFSSPWTLWGVRAVAVLLVSAVFWLFGAWLLAAPEQEHPSLVYRNDYIHKLLDAPDR
ncbi:MAG: helix-turn-helix domain-containing protein [bacterium]|nr:helix-turn-helix domain-containing protein [bacterium]